MDRYRYIKWPKGPNRQTNRIKNIVYHLNKKYFKLD